MRRTVAVTVAAAAALLEALVAAGGYLVLRAADVADARLSPRGDSAIVVADCLLVLLPTAALLFTGMVWMKTERAEERRGLVLCFVGLVLALLLGGVGVVASQTTLSQDFIFASTHVRSVPEPGGRRTAHLYEGPFCGFKVFVGETRDWVVTEVDRLPAKCEDPPPDIAWRDGTPVLVGPDGKRPPDRSTPLF